MGRSAQRVRKNTTTEEKVEKAITAINDIGFRSTNQFIEAYYNSEHTVQSLRAQNTKSYTPMKIMDSWTQHVPDGSRDILNMAITHKAIEIMTEESTTAYHNDKLHLSGSKLNTPYLTTDFGLKKVQETYKTHLPCLYLLLFSLLTAKNDYEKFKNTTKIGKDVMAGKVGYFRPSYGDVLNVEY